MVLKLLFLCPQTPVWDTSRLHLFTQHVSQFRHLHFLTFSLSPLLPLANSWLHAKHGPRLLILHSATSLYYKKFLFRKFLTTSLCVICGSPPPFQSKILATPMAGILTFFAKDKSVNSGFARGGGAARPGCHHFGFLSFETENPLIGRQRPFFLFFLVFTYILADKGCHHEIPPRVPPFFAMPLRVKNV